MARKQLGTAPTDPEDAATKAYVDSKFKVYASEAEFDAEDETVIGILSPATNWGAYTGITSPSANDLTNFSGPALVQTVVGVRSGNVARTQTLLIATSETSDVVPMRRLVRRGNDITWDGWGYDTLVPVPTENYQAANKLYVDARGLNLIAWTDLDSLPANHSRVGLVNDAGDDLGAATGIAKYDGWPTGELWFESHGGYVHPDYYSAQVQRVWVPNADGSLDEITRYRDDNPGYSMSAWSAWAIVTPPGGSGVVETIVAGTGISVDDTDPANPIVSATGGGGSAFDSGETGTNLSGLPGRTIGTRSDTAHTSNRVNLAYFYTPVDITINSMSADFFSITGTGGKVRVAIYEATDMFTPGNWVGTLGTMNVANGEVKQSLTPYNLAAGRYFLAQHSDFEGTLTAASTRVRRWSFMAGQDSSYQNGSHLYATLASGAAWPTTLGTITEASVSMNSGGDPTGFVSLSWTTT
jgi:hypothetical protein